MNSWLVGSRLVAGKQLPIKESYSCCGDANSWREQIGKAIVALLLLWYKLLCAQRDATTMPWIWADALIKTFWNITCLFSCSLYQWWMYEGTNTLKTRLTITGQKCRVQQIEDKWLNGCDRAVVVTWNRCAMAAFQLISTYSCLREGNIGS